MTFKEYAQKIMQGCGQEFFKIIENRGSTLLECGKWREIDRLTNWQHMDYCPSCQRVRQTAIDLSKMELEFLEKLPFEIHHVVNGKLPKQRLDDFEEGRLCQEKSWKEHKAERIKDIQEGLKVLGVEA
jgi:hypothetical protein